MPSDARPIASTTWRAFLAWFVLGVLGAGVFVLGVNILVDPWGLVKPYSLPLKRRIRIADNERMHKAYAVTHVKPRSITLGTSTVSWGLPVDELPQPAFNLGVNASTLREQHRFLEHAIYDSGRLQLVIWGLDPFAFNTRRGDQRGTFDQNDLASFAHGSVAPVWFSDGLLSLDAFISSLVTLRKQAGAPAVYEHGFREPEFMAEKIGTRTRRISEYSVRYQSNEWRGHAHQPEAYDAFEEYRAVLELCRDKGVRVLPFMSVLHVWQLDVLRQIGHWETLENMRRNLVKVHQQVMGPDGKPVPLYDFMGLHPYSEELPQDLNAEQWEPFVYWWDGAHYRTPLAHKMLDVLLGKTPPEGRFGMRLTPDNVEQVIEQDRAAMAEYRRSRPGHVAFVTRNLAPERKDRPEGAHLGHPE